MFTSLWHSNFSFYLRWTYEQETIYLALEGLIAVAAMLLQQVPAFNAIVDRKSSIFVFAWWAVLDVEHRLLLSCEQGDFEIVKRLLEDNRSVDAHDGTDWETALHRAAHAVAFGKETARLLLDNGADIRAKSKNGETPLHVAAETGKVGVVRLLLGAKACMKAMDKRDWLPLRTSASKGHDTIVKILIEKGANKDAFTTDSLEMTALHIAAANGCYRTVLSLIENEADIHAVRGDGGTVLHSAAESGCVSIIATLLAAGAKLDSKQEGKLEIWKLPSFRTKPPDGMSPVHAAALGNHATVLEILLKDGFAVDAPVKVKIVRNLVIEVPIGWTALHMASALGHQEVVAVLLGFKANKEQRTKDMETAMHLAAACLIQAGADLEARAFKQLTPLHYAAAKGQEDMVKLLLDKRAQFEAKTSSGATALHLAANEGHAETVTALMSIGVLVDAVNDAGRTALHIAAEARSPEVVRRLMRSRVDNREKRDRGGKRPIDIAMAKGDEGVVKDVVEALGGRR
ncbi:MAG: hypothetical protein FRX48_04878 [Lasallia pustulata]|uniref:Uncharacterized protein n=1 Tax=Lasallia pustulata TaxID=136370 RepID=A0A5M8PPY4_9LECA|nr:MAG: hypothetical protein FRX48_04878 [Lasallia pustulata]